MILMTITVQLAFLDDPTRRVDTIASEIVRYALDGLDAETAYTSERTEATIDVPDPILFNLNRPDDPFEAWQERAREEMGRRE